MHKHAFALAALALVTAGMAWACGSSPPQPINPDVRMKSTSPDELPPTQTSGLGTPGAVVDAGLPHVPMDGGR